MHLAGALVIGAAVLLALGSWWTTVVAKAIDSTDSGYSTETNQQLEVIQNRRVNRSARFLRFGLRASAVLLVAGIVLAVV